MPDHRECPPHDESGYQVFLLRLWRENPIPAAEEGAGWRFSLESPNNHHRRGFDSLEALQAFLSNQMGGREQRREETKEDK